MMVSAFLYLSPQIPAFLGRAHDPFAALVGGILCSIGLGCYCAYQVIVPELQKRKKAAAHNKFVRANAIKCAMTVASAVGGNALLDASGGINQDTLRKIFVKFDVECNGTLDKDEFRKMMVILYLSLYTGLYLYLSICLYLSLYLSIQAILSSSERICIYI
jgi:hypothetical protein